MNKDLLKYSGIAIAGLGTGFTAGYIISKVVTTKRMRAVIEKELKDMEDYLDRKTDERIARRNIEKPTLEDLQRQREAAEDISDSYRTADDNDIREMTAAEFRETHDRVPTTEELEAYVTDDELPLEELRTVNMIEENENFDESLLGDPMDPPLLVRDGSRPYIIPIGDYMNPEDDFEDYERLTVTFYEDDEVLTDDSTKAIHDVDGLVGLNNLHNFGKDSDNKDIVYVRNEKKQIDFEIMRVHGRYTEIVLGFSPKVSKHTQRMREDD